MYSKGSKDPRAMRRVRIKNRVYRGMSREQAEAAEQAREIATHCACCGSVSPRSVKGWHADHDHETGRFRAIVCHPCNAYIGVVETHGAMVRRYLEDRT